MKRELAIAAGVLVPFAVLVAAGFYFSTPVFPSPQQGRGSGRGVTEVVPLVPVVVPVVPVVVPLVIDAGVITATAPRFPPELAAPLEAVEAEVHQCFADQRVQQPHDVKVRFRPTRDGGYTGVQVDEQDPMLQACIEDVFAELQWEPRGPETYQPAEHTYSFGSPAP